MNPRLRACRHEVRLRGLEAVRTLAQWAGSRRRRLVRPDDEREGHRETMQEEHVEYYKNGSVKGKGLIADGKMEGYWEWFRKDGTKMRSGHFKAGEQVGEWTTYDKTGKVVKVTTMKPKKAR